MFYPSRILPNAKCHAIQDHTLCSSLGKNNIVRFIKEGEQIDTIFKSDKFYTGLSTYLLSSKYKKCDTHWKVTQEEYNDYWDGASSSIMPRKVTSAYRWNTEQQYVGLNIAKLCALHLDGNSVSSEGVPDGIKEYCLVVQHTPTRGNFWHCDVFIKATYHNGEFLILNDTQEMVKPSKITKIARIIRDKKIDRSLLIDREKLRARYIPRKIYMM